MARLLLSIIFLSASLLCVFSAPAYYLWYVQILVTEFPWIFIPASFLLLVWGVSPQRFNIAGTIISLIALLLFISPVVRACMVARILQSRLETAFGDKAANKKDDKPYSILKMVTGIGTPQIPYTTETYSNINGDPMTMDIYPSQLPGNRPCIVVVHGGSWQAGDSKQLPELNTHLANEGYNVVSINYRMAPKYISPAPVEDVAAAIHYLCKEAARLHIDTNNFVLLGRSAGGQIVLDAAYTLHMPCIKGVISYYGPADMVWGYQNPANPLVLNSCKVMEDYLGGTYSQVPQQYINSAATDMASRTSIPTLMIHGKNDPLVAYGHSTRLCEKLKSYGVKYFLLTLPWATHGCDYTLNGPSGQLATYTVDRFLQVVAQ